MRSRYRSIVEALIVEIDGEKTNNQSAIESTGLAICRKIEQMPSLLKMGIISLTFFFDLSGLFFHKKSVSKRIKQINRWRNSPIGAFREFVLFYEKLTLFVYFSGHDK